MAQNIYDDDAFFTAYAGLRRSVEGLEGAAEWPAMRGLLPPVGGGRIVDLGCGYGWFCRWAADNGAATVLGVDLSRRMLDRAVADSDDPAITYRRVDLAQVDLPAGAFDLAYSSLALHYLPDLDPLLATVARALRPGGRLVFSVEHPVYTAPRTPRSVAGPDGAPVWPLDSYLDEGERTTNWLADGVVKYHRTVASHLSALRRAGFALVDLIEWGPAAAAVEAQPELAIERHRPPFLLVSAETTAR